MEGGYARGARVKGTRKGGEAERKWLFSFSDVVKKFHKDTIHKYSLVPPNKGLVF